MIIEQFGFSIATVHRIANLGKPGSLQVSALSFTIGTLRLNQVVIQLCSKQLSLLFSIVPEKPIDCLFISYVSWYIIISRLFRKWVQLSVPVYYMIHNYIIVHSKDRFSLITYSTDVVICFGLTHMTDSNKTEKKKVVNSLVVKSQTNLCEGLLTGKTVIIIYRN